MLKKNVFLLISFLCLSFAFFACKSTPEPVAEEPIVEEVEPITQEEPKEEISTEDALARAQDEIEQAKKNKARIEGLDFINYDSESYQAGCALLDEYNETSEKISALERMELAKKTNDSFKAVLALGFSDYSTKKKLEAVSAKEKCLSLKAQNASKEKFAAADFMLRSADEYFNSQKYEMAYDSYSKSFLAFTELYEEILKKKALADEAIERAKNRMSEVETFALEADETHPLEESDGITPSTPSSEETETADDTATADTTEVDTIDSNVAETIETVESDATDSDITTEADTIESADTVTTETTETEIAE